jgi:hypothetical protein
MFNSLPPQLQHRIDHAFDQIVQLQSGNHTERSLNRKVLPLQANDTYNPRLGGGFLVEGYNLDPAIDDQVSPSQVPLTSIPSALRTLDLPSDDEQILSVFRSAASGWTSSFNNVLYGMTDEMVSRDDWRSVCAVLLEHYEEEYPEDSEIGPMDSDGLHAHDRSMESEDWLSASGNSDGDSDEDYVEGPAASSPRRRTHPQRAKTDRTSFSPNPSSPEKLSPRQQRSYLETFALFFPSISKSEIPNQKITIRDIQRVSKLLGEKINAHEVSPRAQVFLINS